VGKNRSSADAAADYATCVERVCRLADYLVVNVSSPNTPGLRSLQDRPALDELLGHIQRRNALGKPMLLKIAPDLEWAAIEEILGLIEEHKLAGIIATNTTINHSSIREKYRTQGGLSGAPLRERATAVVRFITQRSKVPVIAAGGIMEADDALEKFDAGAALVQLYTGYIYEGPGLIGQICRALLRRG